MSSVSEYFKGLFGGIGALLTGMSVTIKELFAPKVTQQYPENRKTLVISERFRGELIMPHDQNNEHACTSCSICEMNCPNGTIKVTSKMIQTEDGKKKKVLDTYYYNLGMCTFCNLCVLTCPSDAIKFDNVFENAIFTRAKLNMKLNHEGSKLREKKKPAVIAEKPVVKTETQKADASPQKVMKTDETDKSLVVEKQKTDLTLAVEATPELNTPISAEKNPMTLNQEMENKQQADTDNSTRKDDDADDKPASARINRI